MQLCLNLNAPAVRLRLLPTLRKDAGTLSDNTISGSELTTIGGSAPNVSPTIHNLDVILKEVYVSSFNNMLKQWNLNDAIRKGWKRDRVIGRSTWRFRKHTKMGRFLEPVFREADYLLYVLGLIRISRRLFRNDPDIYSVRNED